MINSKLIYKILGQLLFIEAFLLFISLLVALYYQQDDIFALHRGYTYHHRRRTDIEMERSWSRQYNVAP